MTRQEIKRLKIYSLAEEKLSDSLRSPGNSPYNLVLK